MTKLFIAILAVLSASPGDSAHEEFASHWYQGKAEISNYKLIQARYGDLHEGNAVMIFVTEDFSKSELVKLDNPSQAGFDAVKVLKLNATRNFYTGVYPYSTMVSTFTPVHRDEFPNTLKSTATCQEWCGHTFNQFNLEKKHYRWELRSYFQSEGDVNEKQDIALLEDEIWNLIRINPELVPEGNISVYPSNIAARFRHFEMKPYNAVAKTYAHKVMRGIKVFELDYPELKRNLKIMYEAIPPYNITGWEETSPSGFGPNAEMLTTKASLEARIWEDYWNHNSGADRTLRRTLRLD